MVSVSCTPKPLDVLNGFLDPNSNATNSFTFFAPTDSSLFDTIFIIRFPKKTSSIPPLIAEDDFSDSDDETCSLSSTSSESEDDDEEEDENRSGQYFRLKGAGNGDGFLRSCRRSITDIFSLSEIANSKSFVKLWDTIGFSTGGIFRCGGSCAGAGGFGSGGAEEEE
jgi:hypothetical protein